ncbi:MAG TPA: malto-oligosyltrehalose synthase [Reyranellaceae bacterium]|nr:malto-oligosyltrehalose synthase [Reyranellaceae bacterium]
MTPRATQRLQFHRGFTFAHAEALVPYLAELGISHIYASPITTARAGSLHGYDVVDPTAINPELGGEDAFVRLATAAKRAGLGIIVDIVPNHMAATLENAWWRDVLTHGRASTYAASFDIDWHADGKVFLPWLAKPLSEVLTAGELEIVAQPGGTRGLRYQSLVLPLAGNGPLTQALLDVQPWRLGWWRTAGDRINWRRFFDINDLVCLRMEDDVTFERVHALPQRLYARGLIDGVRVDHIDGLADPQTYCRKLRLHLDPAEPARPYLVVEKILMRGESLPEAWGCDGTTGYDFMDQVSALQHDPRGEATLKDAWATLSGRPRDFDAEEKMARREIIARSFAAQVEGCAKAFEQAASASELSRPAARRAVERLLVHFPVYRTYGNDDDACWFDITLEAARCEALPNDLPALALAREHLAPLRRFQQLSAPIAAKAVEDTAFYRYAPLLSRNDVGFDIERFSLSPEEFHELMNARPRNGLNATATHDHKRGEDVRARLAVLSERADDWTERLQRWIAATAAWRRDGAPGDADVAMLLQTVVGAWPLDLAPDDAQGRKAFAQRLAEWQQKALREAKLRSDWADPDEAYEAAARAFTLRLLDEPIAREIHRFVQEIAHPAALKSLGQVLLRLTAPGVPDLYQGCEYWDFSLVDPDNRRPVDFETRRRSLGRRIDGWQSPTTKQTLIARALALRRALPDLFAEGSYEPVPVEGPEADGVVAFLRRHGGETVLVAAPRLTTSLGWRDATLRLPGPISLFDVLHEPKPLIGATSLPLRSLDADIPIGLYASRALER